MIRFFINRYLAILMSKLVVVAMSGGVDSSVVAAMMHEQGHQVIGITMQLYDHGVMAQKKGACCAGQDIYDAKMVADKLGIAHYVFDYESLFRDSVINDFADSYLRGETPLPCVRCNQSVKFRDLLKVAKDLKADFLATGHYVQKINNNGKFELHKGANAQKDQSYFLFATTKEQLQFLEFPLGGYTKEETRNLALKYGLEVADKPDSQDICFVPDGDYRSVITKMRPEANKQGKFVHVDGFELGTHAGIINYTVGQRKGLGIAYGEPIYVIKIDPETNTVYVGPQSALFKTKFTIREMNWLAEDKIDGCEVTARIRSTAEGTPATVSFTSGGSAEITLLGAEKAITPGQACVLYDGTKVLGGGWISREIN